MVKEGQHYRLTEWEEQIVGTQEKSQQIVAQRLLSCLQYLDATKSSAKDLSLPSVNLWLVGSNFCRLVTNRWNQTESISFHVMTEAVDSIA
jgi:hypothetical protein